MDGSSSRRESRIPRPAPGAPSMAFGRPLAEKPANADRKRKVSPVPEDPPTKRQAVTRGAATAAARPNRAAAAAAPAPEPAKPASEETWDDIAASTGMTISDLLGKKLAFKKTTRADDKLKEMQPLVKHLRAAGWHLLTAKEKAEMDVQQWKQAVEQMEQEQMQAEQEWAGRQAGMDAQVKELQAQLSAAEERTSEVSASLGDVQARVAEKEEELRALQASLGSTQVELDRANAQLEEKDGKLKEMEEVMRQSQGYSATLQSYNTSLQNDINQEKLKRQELERARDMLQAQVAELGGSLKSLEQLLQFEKAQVEKMQAEREAAGRDIAVLRSDLDAARSDRERTQAEVERLQAELARFKDAGGKSVETVEMLNHSKATLEAQLDTQRRLLDAMRADLGLAREQRALAESLAESRGTQVSELKAQIEKLHASLTDAERRVFESELIRRKLHNTIQELKGNIRVFCRVRPPARAGAGEAAADELAVDLPCTGELQGRGISVSVPSSSAGAAPVSHSFGFDKVFGPATSQEQVFDEISELVQSALDGHKVCIFAYGQTGSGKTHTMMGTPEQQGVIPRAMQQVFETSRQLGRQGWSFVMQASMLEIYNEEYKDLLAKRRLPEGKKHTVVHDGAGNTAVSELTLVDVSDPQRVQALLRDAMDKRSVGCTNLNEQSSRSHMVFTLRIEGSNSSSGMKVAGVLNLIDLAGSERVKDSGATGVRMTEAQHINKSLSALGDVIMALANKEKHVPYRNSKLTWLLQPSLGGDAKTLMFVNVAPSRDFAPETLCSLRFAAKVNACEIGVAKRNVKV